MGGGRCCSQAGWCWEPGVGGGQEREAPGCMTTSVPSSGDAVERKERGEWKRRMGDMDGSSLGTQRAHLSGRGHLARGSCVVCRCRGGIFMF